MCAFCIAWHLSNNKTACSVSVFHLPCHYELPQEFLNNVGFESNRDKPGAGYLWRT